MKFEDFFTNVIEYPLGHRGFPDEILPFGIDYSYVPSSFINGFINCGDLIGAFMCNRYHAMSDSFSEAEVIGDFTYRSKAELFVKLRAGSIPLGGISVSAFKDDVLLLKRLTSPSGKTSYIYFWCDCDVSDCSIGRFQADLPEAEVVRLFHEHVHQLARHGGHLDDPISLDLTWFRGWLSF